MTEPRSGMTRPPQLSVTLLGLIAALSCSAGPQGLASSGAQAPASKPPQPSATVPPPAGSADASALAASAAGALPQMLLGAFELVANPGTPSGELELELSGFEGKPFGELTRRGLSSKVLDGRLRVKLPTQYPSSSDPVLAAHRACSFVIDCDEPVVRGVLATLPQSISTEQLREFVARFISKKDLSHGFDIASETARSHAGDCSEHAVFYTALARGSGMAARVVEGLALVTDPRGQQGAFGHAWAEVNVDGSWWLADAALGDQTSWKVLYLPMFVMQSEGTNYTVEALTKANVHLVKRVLANPAYFERR